MLAYLLKRNGVLIILPATMCANLFVPTPVGRVFDTTANSMKDDNMKYVEVIRLETSAYGTIGALRINGMLIGNTLEPPYRMNEANKSSIPAGAYILEPYDSPKHGGVWMVSNVPGRTYIEFHEGNTVDHTAGCFLVGESEYKLRGPAEHTRLRNSGATFERFMSILSGGQRHRLVVKELY